ncbi:MAG: class I SAM-dependent methyltransferase, partial [Janthinobacterium lividum]
MNATEPPYGLPIIIPEVRHSLPAGTQGLQALQPLPLPLRMHTGLWRGRRRQACQRGPAAPFPVRTGCRQRCALVDGWTDMPQPRPSQPREQTIAQRRMQAALADSAVRMRFEAELSGTLDLLGFGPRRAREAAELVSDSLLQQTTLAQSSHDIMRLLQIQAALRSPDEDGFDLQQSVQQRLREREEMLFQRLAPHMHDLGDACLLDVGSGDNGIGDLVQCRISGNLAASDLQDNACGASSQEARDRLRPIISYPNATFDAALAVNVLSHDHHKRDSLAELWRVLKPGGKLLAIETVAAAACYEELKSGMECNFLHDFLYRRIFNSEVQLV